jgi:putative membrane protein
MVLLGTICCVYASARAMEVFALSGASPAPNLAMVATDVLSAMAFALVHGALQYRLRGILVFVGICLVVGNVSENLGVLTGFPFGRYEFGTIMGPKLFHVPVLLGLAYIGMAYVSWMVAQMIVRGSPDARRRNSLVTLPLAASFVMVAWDLAMDPVWATVVHAWTWFDGGPWIGVPISNFLGWYGTALVIYLIFAQYVCRQPTGPATPHTQIFELSPAFFYLLCVAGNVAQLAARPVPLVVFDGAGHSWRAKDASIASGAVSLFLMGGFAAAGLIRLGQRSKPATN